MQLALRARLCRYSLRTKPLLIATWLPAGHPDENPWQGWARLKVITWEAVSRWFVYPPVTMCIPAHISLRVICVPPVGIHKTPKLCTRASKGFKENMAVTRVYILKFQPIQTINGRRSECNYWFEIVFGKCIARRQRLQARDTNITTITVQIPPYHKTFACHCAYECYFSRLDRPRIHISLQSPFSDMIYQTIDHRTVIAVMSVVY